MSSAATVGVGGDRKLGKEIEFWLKKCEIIDRFRMLESNSTRSVLSTSRIVLVVLIRNTKVFR